MDYKGEWSSKLGKIIAKDYAIISRFKDSETETQDTDYLHDYFFAGIRGLGTWGATRFIDRQYKYFIDYEEDKNIQILLEITYRNGTIEEVKDVSDLPQSYFQGENSLEMINKNIKEFKKAEHIDN